MNQRDQYIVCGFDSHRPLQKSAKFTLIRQALPPAISRFTIKQAGVAPSLSLARSAMNPQQISWATKAPICLLALPAILAILPLLPTLAGAQSTKITGRITEGTLAARPACPGTAQIGDTYNATGQTSTVITKCDSTGWREPARFAGQERISTRRFARERQRFYRQCLPGYFVQRTKPRH